MLVRSMYSGQTKAHSMTTGVEFTIARRLFPGMIAFSRIAAAEAAAIGHSGYFCADQNSQAHDLVQMSLAFLPIIVQNQIHTRGSYRYEAASDRRFFLHEGKKIVPLSFDAGL